MAHALSRSEEFGSLLHHLRMSRGLRLRDLGPPSTIDSYEHGRRRPRNVAQVRRLAARLAVEDNVLLAPLGMAADVTRVGTAWEALLARDARQAAAGAQRRVRAAAAAADTAGAVRWGYAHNRALAAQSLIPLPVSTDGQVTVPDLITAAGHALAADAWPTARVLLDTARPLVPPASPWWGYYAALSAQLLSVLGNVAEADRYARAAYVHHVADQDPWRAMLAAAVVVLNATRQTPIQLPGDMMRVLDGWRRPDGRPDPLVQAWSLDARARDALGTGDVARLRALSQRLTRLLQTEPAVEPEAHRIIEMSAWVSALDGRPAEALARLDQALVRAVALGLPGFQLLDTILSDCALAWRAGDPRAPRQSEWLVTLLRAYGAGPRAAGMPGAADDSSDDSPGGTRLFGTFPGLLEGR